MTVGIVDVLEVIEIDEAYGEAFLAAPGELDGLVDAVFEQNPVGQPGRCIVQRHVSDVAQHVADIDDPLILVALYDEAASHPGSR